MAWQAEVGSGSARATDYRDLLTKLVGFLTSQHVSAVAVNAGGSGYTTGDIIETNVSGGSEFLKARFEVTATAGAVTALRLVSSGAFANRAVSAAIGAGGSGYQVNDILEVEGGAGREKAKFRVTTVSSGAVTAVALFETGGSYTSTPSNDATTRGVGFDTGVALTNPPTSGSFSGGTGCELTVTYSGAPPTTGQPTTAVTGGGTGCTVDLTFTDTGWAVNDDINNSRNTNNEEINSIANEKEVVLVGDASGIANKPYVALRTVTQTDGLDTRYSFQYVGLITHNPALEVHNQVSRSNGWGDGNPTSGAYMLCPQNINNDFDFWFSADDIHVSIHLNENPSANTDDGRYFHGYFGYIDRVGTESEDPYPYYVFGSAGEADLQPSQASDFITGIHELRTQDGFCSFYYATEIPGWRNLVNVDGTAPSYTTDEQEEGMAPVSEPFFYNQGGGLISVAENVSLVGGQARQSDFSPVTDVAGRGASARRIIPTPGTTPRHWLVPLTIFRGSSSQSIQFNSTTDRIRGQVRGIFWVYNSDASGAQISNFSEDYIEDDDGTRYRIFHNHLHIERYQYIAVKEDV